MAKLVVNHFPVTRSRPEPFEPGLEKIVSKIAAEQGLSVTVVRSIIRKTLNFTASQMAIEKRLVWIPGFGSFCLSQRRRVAWADRKQITREMFKDQLADQAEEKTEAEKCIKIFGDPLDPL
jgi:nucleoid DNA-binding protein